MMTISFDSIQHFIPHYSNCATNMAQAIKAVFTIVNLPYSFAFISHPMSIQLQCSYPLTCCSYTKPVIFSKQRPNVCSLGIYYNQLLYH